MASPLYAVRYCVVVPGEDGRLRMSCGPPERLAQQIAALKSTVCAIEQHPDGRLFAKCDKAEKIAKTLSKLR